MTMKAHSLLEIGISVTLLFSVCLINCQRCKLIRKFSDVTGSVDMRETIFEGATEEFLRQNPSVICVAWRINGYDREAVRIQFKQFNISNRILGSNANSPHATSAKERPAVSTISGPYCGDFSEDSFFWWSNGNDVTIEYHIRSLEQAKFDKLTFQFSVLTPVHGCGYEAIVYSPSVIINASAGEISSPYDRTIATHARCYWAIEAPRDKAFLIEFMKYTVDEQSPFVLTVNDIFDPLYSNEGSAMIAPKCCERKNSNPESQALEIYDDGIQCICQKGLPPAVESTTNLVHVYFESRSTLSAINQGFSLKWRQIPRQNIPTLATTTTPSTTTANNASSVSNNLSSTEKSLLKSLDDAYGLDTYNFNDTYYQFDEVTTLSEATKESPFSSVTVLSIDAAEPPVTVEENTLATSSILTLTPVELPRTPVPSSLSLQSEVPKIFIPTEYVTMEIDEMNEKTTRYPSEISYAEWDNGQIQLPLATDDTDAEEDDSDTYYYYSTNAASESGISSANGGSSDHRSNAKPCLTMSSDAFVTRIVLFFVCLSFLV